MSLFRGLPSPLFFFNAAEGNCAVDAFSQTRLARSIQAIPYFCIRYSPELLPLEPAHFFS